VQEVCKSEQQNKTKKCFILKTKAIFKKHLKIHFQNFFTRPDPPYKNLDPTRTTGRLDPWTSLKPSEPRLTATVSH